MTNPLRAVLRALVPTPIRAKTYPVRRAISRFQSDVRSRLGIFWDARLKSQFLKQEAFWRWKLRILWRIIIRCELLEDMERFEFRICSQNGEDGILAALFARIGTTNRYFVEFGVEDGVECNTALLRRQGWKGLQMDARECNPPWIKLARVTAENVNSLFDRFGVPDRFDLLSIDIDGNDYWVWKATAGRRPRVVVIEYNGMIPPSESRVIPYNPDYRWDTTAYYGASLLALQRLGRQMGYTLIACDSKGVNAFFVEDALVPGRFRPRRIEAIYRPLWAVHRHPPAAPGRRWVEVQAA